ncbi:hypothetical protein [Kribbella sp. NPDC000426]|uniref:hypothetical protein n=1 Tax=Kribbella sp. NPDC000426 TaxID=3154255 RepID=UPI003321B3E2
MRRATISLSTPGRRSSGWGPAARPSTTYLVGSRGPADSSTARPPSSAAKTDCRLAWSSPTIDCRSSK